MDNGELTMENLIYFSGLYEVFKSNLGGGV